MTFYEAFVDEMDKLALKGARVKRPLRRKREAFFLKGDPAGKRYFHYLRGKGKGLLKREFRKK